MTERQLFDTQETSGADLVAGDLTTTHSLSSGEAVRGFVNTGGEQDWYEVDLVAGQEYTFAMNGFGQEALSDPYVRLFDSSGAEIANDDDDGPGWNSHLTFTASTTETYYIASDAFSVAYTGEYLLTMNSGSTPYIPEVEVEDIADFLTDAYWLNYGSGGPRQWDATTVTYNVQNLTPERAELARLAFETWEDLIDMDFAETTDNDADIFINDSQDGAFANTTVINGIITESFINIDDDWQGGDSDVDSYTFQTFIHEIGHAIGLGHGGPYDADDAPSYGVDNVYANDSWQMTVMSYFSQEAAGTGSHRNVMTPMMADILAAQNLYGAAAARSGDTVYGFGSTAGSLYDFDNYTQAPSFTIYDTGGIDHLDASGYSHDQWIDLGSGMFSDIGGLEGNIGISLDSVIENATGGAGDDRLIGNDADNVLAGRHGNDDLFGGSGNDDLFGGIGNDLLYGGIGNDDLRGGAGDDNLYGGPGNDVLRGGPGNDILFGGPGDDVLRGGGGEDVLRGAGGDDQLFGGAQDDRLYGGGGEDTLRGGGGDDILRGGAHDDRLYGSGGNDRLLGGGGDDLLRGGSGNDILRGGGGEDRLFGAGGDDRLFGGAGDDILRGGGGDDILRGGGGDDILRGNAGSDVLRGNAGNDVLRGNGGSDRLFGGGGDDVLIGGAGNDRLVGGGGNDRLVGQTGNDRLVGNAGADLFVFQPNGGNDLVVDFQNDLDRLDFRAFNFANKASVLNLATQVGADVVFGLPGGESVELNNFNINLLGAEDIVI